MPRRPSPQTTAVLRALGADPTTWRYGYELGQEVGLKAGSLYPILMRLSDRGLLEASWEAELPAGRPARHLYRLTTAGAALAAELAELADLAEAVELAGSVEPAKTPQPKSEPSRRQLRGAW